MASAVGTRAGQQALAVLVVLSFVLSFAVSSARAAPVANPHGRMLGTVLALTAASAPARARIAGQAAAGDSSYNLRYHGGPVMHADHTYSVYWEPPGNVSAPAYKDGVDRYLTDVATDSGQSTNVYAAQSLYWDAAGVIPYASSFDGRIVDSSPYPAGGCPGVTGPCVSDAQLQAELTRLVAADSLPTGERTMYLIFTPPGVNTCDQGSCSFSSFCAYHSWIGTGPSALIYADQPYVAGVAGCDPGNHPNADDADATVNVVSHEQNEAVTDPEGTGWWDAAGNEDGDKCAWNFGTPLGSTAGGTYNQSIAGHVYSLQQEWSNVGSACVLTNASDEAPSVTMATPAPASGALPNQQIAFGASGAEPDGTIAAYAWSFGDGQTATGLAVSHAYAGYGDFTVTVTATDTDGQTATDAQIVSVIDQPVALVTATPDSPLAGGSVTLDGSASHSPGGAITSYNWALYDADGTYSTASGASITHLVLHPGTLEADLSVTDASGFTGWTYAYITVRARPPTAALSASATRQYTNLSIDFDGTASAGPDDPIASYRWSFGDGHTSTSSSPSHTFAAAGDYPVTLTVTDTQGQSAEASQTVTIVNRPPVPTIVYLPRTPTAGQLTEFDGSGASAPDGSIASYAWDFGDGQTAGTAAPDHYFAAPGTYTVTLSVTDSAGATGTIARPVVVAAPTPAPPSSSPSASTSTSLADSQAPPARPVTPVSPPSGRLGLGRQQRAASLRRAGLRFSVTCGAACRIAYALVIPAHAPHSAALVAGRRIAGGTGSLPRIGTWRAIARLPASAIGRLTATRQLLLIVTLTDPRTGQTRSLTAATSVN